MVRQSDQEISASEKTITVPKRSRHAATGRATPRRSGIDQEAERAGENYGKILSYGCYRKEWKRHGKQV